MRGASGVVVLSVDANADSLAVGDKWRFQHGRRQPWPEWQKVKAAGVCGIHTVSRIAWAPLALPRSRAEQLRDVITLRLSQGERGSKIMAESVSFGEVVARHPTIACSGQFKSVMPFAEQRPRRFCPAADAYVRRRSPRLDVS